MYGGIGNRVGPPAGPLVPSWQIESQLAVFGAVAMLG